MAAKKKTPARQSKPDPSQDGVSKPPQRWTKAKKLEVVLRLLRGEPLDAVSRELGVETYRLEAWKEKALSGMKSGLSSRPSQDPVQAQLDAALKRVGELTMDNELLQIRCKKVGVSPFVRRRSKP